MQLYILECKFFRYMHFPSTWTDEQAHFTAFHNIPSSGIPQVICNHETFQILKVKLDRELGKYKI